VLLCLANLVTYLLVDVYFYYRMKREVPSFLRDLFTSLVYIFFAMTMLRVIFQLDISSILTTTTVLTAAVAFAMQTTIANFFSGFYVQNDRNLRLKTWIALKDQDVVGEIVNVGFRYTTLKSWIRRRSWFRTTTSCRTRDESRVRGRAGADEDRLEGRPRVRFSAREGEKPVAADPAAGQGHRERPPADGAGQELRGQLHRIRSRLFPERLPHLPRHPGERLTRIWYAVTREGYSIPFPHREVIAKTAREPFAVGGETLLAVLRRTEILQSLSDEESRRLSERLHIRVFATGETVVLQGDPGGSLFIVLQGGLKVSIDETQVGTLAVGEIFGEMALLTGEKRKATVTAAAESHLVEILKRISSR